MHQVQKEKVECPNDPTRLKEIQVKSNSRSLTMPTGTVSVPASSVTMVMAIW